MLTDRVADHRKVPDVDADQTEMAWMVSVEVMDQGVGVADNERAPRDAVEKVACSRVVTADRLAVPADPGSPVCN